jgi:hypothetical protein
VIRAWNKHLKHFGARLLESCRPHAKAFIVLYSLCNSRPLICRAHLLSAACALLFWFPRLCSRVRTCNYITPKDRLKLGWIALGHHHHHRSITS